MIAMLQVPGGPGVPAGMWDDRYILGFAYLTIGGWAKFTTRGKIGNDIPYVLIDVFAAITNMSGVTLLIRANKLLETEDPEFNRGQDNSATLFLYANNQPKSDENNPIVQSAMRSAKALAAQPSQSQITNFITQQVWVDEVRRVAAGQ
jgi:hypothetical protein